MGNNSTNSEPKPPGTESKTELITDTGLAIAADREPAKPEAEPAKQPLKEEADSVVPPGEETGGEGENMEDMMFTVIDSVGEET